MLCFIPILTYRYQLITPFPVLNVMFYSNPHLPISTHHTFPCVECYVLFQSSPTYINSSHLSLWRMLCFIPILTYRYQLITPFPVLNVMFYSNPHLPISTHHTFPCVECYVFIPILTYRYQLITPFPVLKVMFIFQSSPTDIDSSHLSLC